MNRSRLTLTQGITVVVLGLLIVSALGTVPMGVLAQTNESEPNDAQDAATVIEESEVNGEIGDEGDVDWYEFRVEENTEVSILFNADPSDTMLFFDLIGPDGETIDDTNIGRTSTRGQIATTVEESGTYYIDVHASSGGSEVPYSFDIQSPDDVSTPTPTETETPASTGPTNTSSATTPNETSVQEQSREEIEPNDAQDAATGLNSTKIDGEIGDEGDVDWYEFRVEENTEVSILFTADPSDTMLFFDLIGPDGETIDDTNIGRTSTRGQIATTVEESGTYYIDVHASSGGSEVPYSSTIHSPDDVSPPTATATQTSTQISTATQTSTATQNNTSGEVIADDETTATTTDDGDDGSGASGPGFGIVAALVALVAVVVLSVRR